MAELAFNKNNELCRDLVAPPGIDNLTSASVHSLVSFQNMTDTALPDHKIRLAVVADATEIAGCLSALGYGTSASLVAERLASIATSLTDAVFVAFAARQTSLLGVISVHLLPLFHAPGFLGRITSLAVNSEARGKGVGKALVTAAEEWAWNKDSRRMEVTSGDHRQSAHAFYQAAGYSLDERRFIKHAPKVS